MLELRISLNMNGICIIVRAPWTPHYWEWNNRGGLMRMVAQEDLKEIIGRALGSDFRVICALNPSL